MEKTTKRRFGDRKDGVLLRDLDGMHFITPIIYPNRCDNEAYLSETIDLTNMNAYLEKKNAENPDFPYTMFHVIVAGLIKTITLRPKMNRFIANKNFYQRNGVSASFVVKKQFADEAAEALAAAIAKQEEYLAMAQRVQADFENFRRRNQNVRKEAFDDGARAFATTLLPVIDNLERAITAAGENAGESDSLKSGVEMVLRQMCEAFEKRGITPISRQGEKFDPNLENAVMQGAPEDGEPGTVCEVLLKGYQMEGTVLRHAMVKVVPE